VLGTWFAFKGLHAWEKWMKDQEQKDIEKEIKMTGKYINPFAKDIGLTIDPLTGKKFISDEEKKKIKWDQKMDKHDCQNKTNKPKLKESRPHSITAI